MAKRSSNEAGDNHAAVLKADGQRVFEGQEADIWLIDEAKLEYAALLERNDINGKKAQIQFPRYFERWANGQRLGDDQFKPQGRRNAGQVTVQIFEFKAFQFRIYGVVVNVDGKRAFIGTAADPSKKKNKADPSKIQKAADVYVRMFK